MDWLPIVKHVVVPHLVDIDQPGVAPRLVADDASPIVPLHLHRNRNAIADIVAADRCHNLVLFQKASHRRVAARRIAAAYANLVQPGSFAYQDAESPRRYLCVERAVVPFTDTIEFRAVVGDKPGKNVQPACGTLGIAHRGRAFPQRQALEQRNDVDATALEHAAVGDVHLVHREVFESLLDRRIFPGKETGTHPVPGRPQPEGEAGRLILVVLDRFQETNFPGYPDLALQLLRRQYPGRANRLVRVVFRSAPDPFRRPRVIDLRRLGRQMVRGVTGFQVRSDSYGNPSRGSRPWRNRSLYV